MKTEKCEKVRITKLLTLYKTFISLLANVEKGETRTCDTILYDKFFMQFLYQFMLLIQN